MTTRTRRFLIFGLIVAITLAIYVPNLSIHYVNWDYASYEKVLDARDFRATAYELLTDFEGTIVPGYYAPVCSISLLADKFLIGSSTPQAWWTHLLNVLIHCLNGLLVYLLVRKIGDSEAVAWIAALIFLIHPVNSGTVLWFAGRKTVLASAFYLSAFSAYLSWREKGRWPWFCLCLLLFTLGQLTKPTVSVFPLALLVTELLVFRRASGAGDLQQLLTGTMRGPTFFQRIAPLPWMKVFLSILPFFLISAGLSRLAVHSEDATVNLNLIHLPLINRPFNAAAAVCFYVGKVLLPVNLIPMYPRWQVDLSSIWWWMPLLALICAAGWALFRHDRIPGTCLWASGNFLIPLLPVVGLVKFGFLMFSFVSNHLLYLSMVGACHLMALGIEGARRRLGDKAGRAVYVGLAAYMVFPGVQTVGQTHVWKDSVTLWSYVSEKNPGSWRAWSYLGSALSDAGRLDQSVEAYEKAVATRPNFSQAYFELALALRRKGDLDGAIERLNKVLELDPKFGAAYSNLGLILLDRNKIPDAITRFAAALALDPGDAMLYYHMGLAEEAAGRRDSAARWYQDALNRDRRLVPALEHLGGLMLERGDLAGAIAKLRSVAELGAESAKAHGDLAASLKRHGDYNEAILQYKEAIRLDPRSPELQNNLGLAMDQVGLVEQALACFRKASKLGPNLAEPFLNMGNALLKIDRLTRAEKAYRNALTVRPDFADAHNNLGVVLEAMGRQNEALEHFKKAVELKPDHAQAKENLESAIKKSTPTGTKPADAGQTIEE